jgi:hypothetical protein
MILPGNYSEIDCSFFVVTADLWSSDGHSERNLVLHPTSSDRYSAAQAPKKRRPNYSGEETSSQSKVPPGSRYPTRMPSEDQVCLSAGVLSFFLDMGLDLDERTTPCPDRV